ncbi:ribonuclease H-like protein [Microstroma glucosiphilum]|uniref:ribonuclease H n=1 Tax=Pseudomicrostroma glucosiphilum TaxID=1684307 RepID=A0A316U2S3_9BASI|nr:ribonuclease H-like protein [Pseudomicrostroma glucosiphilum]PWN19616.1 ribonuclease H-like protein [Pseudomicrostroma glucosiphilum]
MFDWHQLNLERGYPGEGRETVVIYCDGAALRNGKTGASAGYGVWFQRICHRDSNCYGPVEGPQTNQRAELTASITSLPWVLYEGSALRHKISPIRSPLVIFTDSRYTINCLTDWVNRWQLNNFTNAKGLSVVNEDLIRDVMEVREAHDGKVRLQYVPGHSGSYGNDQADRLACMAAREYEQYY